jgi:hypothetical protein
VHNAGTHWFRLLLAISLLAMLIGVDASSGGPAGMGRTAHAQTNPAVYFPETGHTVDEVFWEFWRDRGDLRIFGYPIARPFEQDGVTMQYFQRMRFERWPDREGVVLPLLGDEAGASQPAVPPPDGPLPDHIQYFEETGHYVSHGILEFFQANGGVDIFGYPITEPSGDANYVEQWFQRARLEWRPDRGVELGLLGRELAERYGIDRSPVPQPDGVPEWTELFFAPPDPLPSPAPDADLRTLVLQRTGFDLPMQPGEHWIEVSLAQQRIWAWEGTNAVYTDLVSSGRAGFGTPAGSYRILRRIFNETMDSRSIGIPQGHPDFYYLENVLYTQYYTNVGHAIHYAWWHDNFGTPTSAGCINLRYGTARFFWNWAGIGTRIMVH